MDYVWWSEGNFWEWVLCFQQVGTRVELRLSAFPRWATSPVSVLVYI